MKITRIGHACVLLQGSKNILIDPFFQGNPAAALTVDQIPKLDYIIVTHDHSDHFGAETIALARRDNATLVAVPEITSHDDVTTASIKTLGINIGGTFVGQDISFSITPAIHSAKSGSPFGVVVTLDGKRIYHAGDTAFFSDMRFIPLLHGSLDVALLPIGGHFTMDINSAVMAVTHLKPIVTMPIHYNTWPIIQTDPHQFVEKCGATTKVVVVDPGESYDVV